AGATRYRSESSARNGQQSPSKAKMRAVQWSILCPANRSADPTRPEIVAINNLFDKHPQRAFECAKHIVHRHHGAVDQERLEHVEIGFGSIVGVVAIDPEK